MFGNLALGIGLLFSVIVLVTISITRLLRTVLLIRIRDLFLLSIGPLLMVSTAVNMLCGRLVLNGTMARLLLLVRNA